MRSEIGINEQETAAIAKGLGANDLFLQGVAEADIGVIESAYTAASNQAGFFAAVSDMKGKIIWKSESSIEKLNFSSGLAGQTITDLYANGEDMYFQTGCPIYFGGVQVGALVVGYDLSNTDIVDSVKEQTGNEVTIFSGDVRLNTTVVNDKGERAVGTQLDGKISSLVLTGDTYSGKATIIGQKMSTKYEPLTNNSGEIIGILFAGQPTTESDRLFRNVVILLIGM